MQMVPLTVVWIGVHKDNEIPTSKYFLCGRLNSMLQTTVGPKKFVFRVGKERFKTDGSEKILSFILFATSREQIMEMRKEALQYTQNIEGHLFVQQTTEKEKEDWWKHNNGCQLYFMHYTYCQYWEAIQRTLPIIKTKFWYYRKHPEWQKLNPLSDFQKPGQKRKSSEGDIRPVKMRHDMVEQSPRAFPDRPKGSGERNPFQSKSQPSGHNSSKTPSDSVEDRTIGTADNDKSIATEKDLELEIKKLHGVAKISSPKIVRRSTPRSDVRD